MKAIIFFLLVVGGVFVLSALAWAWAGFELWAPLPNYNTPLEFPGRGFVLVIMHCVGIAMFWVGVALYVKHES